MFLSKEDFLHRSSFSDYEREIGILSRLHIWLAGRRSTS